MSDLTLSYNTEALRYNSMSNNEMKNALWALVNVLREAQLPEFSKAIQTIALQNEQKNEYLAKIQSQLVSLQNAIYTINSNVKLSNEAKAFQIALLMYIAGFIPKEQLSQTQEFTRAEKYGIEHDNKGWSTAM